MNWGILRMMRRAVLTLHIVIAASFCAAQGLLQAPRADGAMTPMRVYAASVQGCAPLALISPGAGGSEDGYSYLGKGMQALGWRAIVIGHRESGHAALMGDIKQERGIKRGLRELVDDPKAYEGRLMDIGAALKWASSTCKAPYVALIGHSMGARTVMVEAGAKLKFEVKGAAQDRFDAYVALSPDGPDPMFPEHAWSGIKKPMLVMTGTLDKSMATGGYESRTIPYKDMPAGCKWLGVIDNATHMNFAGVGFAGNTEKLTLLEIKGFLNGLRDGKCGSPVQAAGITAESK